MSAPSYLIIYRTADQGVGYLLTDDVSREDFGVGSAGGASTKQTVEVACEKSRISVNSNVLVCDLTVLGSTMASDILGDAMSPRKREEALAAIAVPLSEWLPKATGRSE